MKTEEDMYVCIVKSVKANKKRNYRSHISAAFCYLIAFKVL